MSLLSLDNVALIISDLNKEISYKTSEDGPPDNKPALILSTDGDNHSIWFYNELIWDSLTEKNMDPIPVEVEMDLNERRNFEAHLRLLIGDQVNKIKNLEM